MTTTAAANRTFTADVTTTEGTARVIVHATDDRHARAALLKRFGFGAQVTFI